MIDETEALAEAFSRLLKPVKLEGCPCCTDDTVGKRLREGSGWSASTRDLDHYAPKAMTTWGSVNDFKHFLPAIFERSLGGQLGTPFEIVLGKLGYGEFENRPEHEKAAVRTWLSISFGNCPYSIRSHPPQTQYLHSTLEWADAVLAGGASLFEDVTPAAHGRGRKEPGVSDVLRFRVLRPTEAATEQRLLGAGLGELPARVELGRSARPGRFRDGSGVNLTPPAAWPRWASAPPPGRPTGSPASPRRRPPAG